MTGVAAASYGGLEVIVPVAESASRPNRLVIVRDRDHGDLAVWWHLSRRRMWRCPIHGRQAAAACAHTRAAAAALAEQLLGVEAAQSACCRTTCGGGRS